MVRDCVEQIRAGEAFQIVASQRFELATQADPLDVYRMLRRQNPSPYMYLLRLADFSIVGASPEALVTVRDGAVTIHPIAGTKPRGATGPRTPPSRPSCSPTRRRRPSTSCWSTSAATTWGRVSVPGTVKVLEFMNVRRYSHVMHLEAEVTGLLAPGRTALDATLAGFPAGTLSGAPKVRAMEIIDELELTRRGVYGGAVGYFDFAGNADTAIAIRTALIKGGVAHVQAGPGSSPTRSPRSSTRRRRTRRHRS